MVAVKMNPIQKEVCYLIAKGIDGDMDVRFRYQTSLTTLVGPYPSNL